MVMQFPKAWSQVNASTVPAKPARSAVTARIDMSAEVAGAGLCPECRQPMGKTIANGIPTMRCLNCRIVLPCADESA